MIERLRIQNFMRLKDTGTLSLGPVTLLVGANGSGKSSVLKATHWAVRCASLTAGKKPGEGMVTLDRMDFAPSKEFRELAHKTTLRSKQPKDTISVALSNEDGDTRIEITAANNNAGVKAPIEGPLSEKLTQEDPQTAYIPGLAGVAEYETILALPVLRRKAASGEGGSVLRQILLQIADRGDTTGETTGDTPILLDELGRWVSEVIPGTSFWVKFDQRRDAYLEAWFLTPDMKGAGGNDATWRRPIEMAGTGLLQITQIFAYLLRFKPTLLLIDEPDAHLHPGTQERLIKTLEKAAESFPQTQFILTTHSPNLVRSSGPLTEVIWMADGKVRSEGQIVRERMGWSALDKELILFTEDKNFDSLKSLIEQWPDLSAKILIWPTFGKSGLPFGGNVDEIRKRLQIRVAIHRDRDFMTDEDISAWCEKREYTKFSVPVWATPGSDIESIFCRADHISKKMDIPLDVASEIIIDALTSLDRGKVEADFNHALLTAVAEIKGDQRSVPSMRWREMDGFGMHTVKGKVLLDAIKQSRKTVLKHKGYPEKSKFWNSVLCGDSERPLCPDLESFLRQSLNQVPEGLSVDDILG